MMSRLRRTRSQGRRLITCLVAVTAVLCGGVVAYGQTSDESPGSNQGKASDAFSAFERPERAGDVPARTSPSVKSSRLLRADGGIKVYAVTNVDGEVCLVLQTAEVGSVGCAPLSNAASDEPIVLFGAQNGEAVAVGLLHDGPSQVQVARPDSRGAESQTVANNVFVVRGKASAVSWEKAGGGQATQSLDAPVGLKPPNAG